MRFPSPTAFLGDRRGNVAMMYALMLPVLIFGAGFAIDYTDASNVRTQLNAAADAAALAALTPGMMQQTTATAQTAAQNMFNGQIAGISTLVAGQTTVNVSFPQTSSPLIRTVTVAYTAQNQNIFAGILGVQSLALAGSSTATASRLANVDFYLLLDNSPSMALPATVAGINSMIALTAQQDGGLGCAFACHQAETAAYWNPSNTSQNCTGAQNGCQQNGDVMGNSCVKITNGNPVYTAPTRNSTLTGAGNSFCSSTQGVSIDNYQMARNANITLRLDALSTGVSALMSDASLAASSTGSSTPPQYRFAAYAMDSSWQIGMSTSNSNNQLMALTTNYVSGWASGAPNFGVMEYFGNNYACGNSSCSTDSTTIGDWATNYDNALSTMNSLMPDPGQGSNVAGNSPQEVLFIVTDGVEDENTATCSQSEPSWGSSRCQAPMSTAWCTTIKNRNIQIAILYTDYFPIPADSWYTTWVAPFQSTIASQLQSCASPNLFYDAGVDSSNIGADLNALFTTIIHPAHLTN